MLQFIVCQRGEENLATGVVGHFDRALVELTTVLFRLDCDTQRHQRTAQILRSHFLPPARCTAPLRSHLSRDLLAVA